MKQDYKRPRIIYDFDAIKEELEINNLKELSSIMKPASKYLLIEKLISFADVTTSRKLRYLTGDKNKSGAFTKEKIEKRIKKNSSFYATFDEMIDWEWKHRSEKVFFCQTKQASIYMPSIFYSFLGVSDPTTRNKPSSNWSGQYQLNGKRLDVFLCNSSVEKYFTKEATQKTYDKLSRVSSADELSIKEGHFTKIDMHVTPHGLGTTADKVFAALRNNVFAKDKFVVLVEVKPNGKKQVFVSFFRNPKFFILNDIYNKDYILAKYRDDVDSKGVQESRKGQAKWRDELAEYSISLSADDEGCVECPFTGVRVQYPSESAFLRASHIKAYSKCKDGRGDIKVEEAYDLDNGFLVIADVDALFDKYLISVNPDDGKIVTSCLLSKDVLDHLSLKKSVDSRFMSDKKKIYLQIHYNEFEKRRTQI